MKYKIFILSGIVFTSFAVFWAVWSGQTIQSIQQNSIHSDILRCSNTIHLFLHTLHYGYIAIAWLPLIAPPILYLSYKHTNPRPLKIDIALGFLILASFAACVLWFLLVILLWLIVWYDEEVCIEASDLVDSYLITSSVLTTVIIVAVGFQLASRRPRSYTLTEEMIT